MKKAQALSIDFTIGLMILFFLLLFLFIKIENLHQQTAQQSQILELQLLASTISEKLLYTQGSPNNWHEGSLSSVESIGLRSGYVLSADKIKNLSLYSNEALQNKTGILGPGYAIGIRTLQFNGSEYVLYNETGQFPNASTSYVALRQRYGIITNWTRVDVYVHKE